MAFNWNFKPRTLNGFNSAPVESFMPQAPGAIPTQMKGQGFSPDYNIQGLPQDTEDYQRAAYMDAYEANEAQKAQALQAQQAGQQKRIADIQNQIATLEKRIAENTAKLQNFAGNADKIAAIEARKINVNDPTSIWRWKEDRDNARRIANEQNKPNNSARANALIEANNILDSMIINDSLDTPTKNAMLSKLADVKTNLEKNELPTKDVDKKIELLKGNGEQTKREEATTDFETLLNNPNLSVELLDKFEASNPNLSRADWGKLDNKRAELINKANKKAENEANAKERETKILGRNPNSVTSDEISFMEKRGYKRITGDKLSDTKWVKVK
jgi:hypothetical protein